jgi:hypothetical protein
MKKNLNKILIMCGILGVINVAWSLAEYLIYGEITYRKIDTVVALILGYSLYFNYKNFMRGEDDLYE